MLAPAQHCMWHACCLTSVIKGTCGQGSVSYFPSVVQKLAQSAWFVISQCAMSCSVASSPFSSEERFEHHEHHRWNPMLESLCHTEVSVVMEALLYEVDMEESFSRAIFLWMYCAIRHLRCQW